MPRANRTTDDLPGRPGRGDILDDEVGAARVEDDSPLARPDRPDRPEWSGIGDIGDRIEALLAEFEAGGGVLAQRFQELLERLGFGGSDDDARKAPDATARTAPDAHLAGADARDWAGLDPEAFTARPTAQSTSPGPCQATAPISPPSIGERTATPPRGFTPRRSSASRASFVVSVMAGL